MTCERVIYSRSWGHVTLAPYSLSYFIFYCFIAIFNFIFYVFIGVIKIILLEEWKWEIGRGFLLLCLNLFSPTSSVPLPFDQHFHTTHSAIYNPLTARLTLATSSHPFPSLWMGNKVMRNGLRRGAMFPSSFPIYLLTLPLFYSATQPLMWSRGIIITSHQQAWVRSPVRSVFLEVFSGIFPRL